MIVLDKEVPLLDIFTEFLEMKAVYGKVSRRRGTGTLAITN